MSANKSLLQLALAPERTERDEERDCDHLIAMLGGKEAVVQRSPPHKFMGTRGIPDRRYRLFTAAFDFEVKKPAGELSDFQITYLRAERACGCLAACGTLQDLMRCVEWLRDARGGKRTYKELVELIGGIVEAWVTKREDERRAVAERKSVRSRARAERLAAKAARVAERARKRALKEGQAQ